MLINLIIESFYTSQPGNTATMALIKTAFATFGVDNVYSLKSTDDIKNIVLKDGTELIIDGNELLLAEHYAAFERSKNLDPSLAGDFEKIRLQAVACYAVMAAKLKLTASLPSFKDALVRLQTGYSPRFIAELLGLQNHVEYRTTIDEAGTMLAWSDHEIAFVADGVVDINGDSGIGTYPFSESIVFSQEAKMALTLTESLSSLNFLNVNTQGTFIASGDARSTPEDVDNLFKYLKEKQIKKLLIHFHGGLISEKRGMDGAQEMFDHYKNVPDTHVLSFVWETGALTSLPAAFAGLFKSSLIGRIYERVVRVIGGDAHHLYAAGNLYSPIDQNMVISLMSRYEGLTDDEIKDQAFAELNAWGPDELLTQAEIATVEKDEKKLGLDVNVTLLWLAAGVIYRYISRNRRGRDHGPWETLIEEIARAFNLSGFGTGMWSKMKKQANLMWQDNKHRAGLNMYAGRYFSDALIAYKQSNELSVHVVGHSAGAVALCEWIDMLQETNTDAGFNFKDVIFLAPACTCQLFSRTVIKYPGRYSRFRMFTMDDMLESKDNVIPLPILNQLYGKSLLYLISGVLEGAEFRYADAYILGLHRHIRMIKPYNISELKIINEFLFLPQPYQNRLVLSPSSPPAPPGWTNQARSHGGFAVNAEVIQSIKAMVGESHSF